MKIKFSIPFNTRWGQHIGVCGNIPELGSGNPEMGLRLNYSVGDIWSGWIELKTDHKIIDYKYFLYEEDTNLLEFEDDESRIINLEHNRHSILRSDLWNKVKPENKALNSSVFTEVLFSKPQFVIPTPKAPVKNQVYCRIDTHYIPLLEEEVLCITGNILAFGQWNIDKPLLLNGSNFPNWSIDFNTNANEELEFKFGIYSSSLKQVIKWEKSETRIIKIDEYYLHQKFQLNEPVFDHEKWRGTGVALPVFSLKTENSFGVGEFLDLIPAVNWAKSAGLKMIQILPINDTSATFSNKDSYPYAAISVFALHPIYLNLERIGVASSAINELKANLNAFETVQYESVISHKMKLARDRFNEVYESLKKDKLFESFVKENQIWLKDYALFCVLRDQFKTVNFNVWENFSVYSPSLFQKVEHKEMVFYMYLQFHLHLQLFEATEFARHQEVVLKGDLPIGIYRYSVDAWVAPNLYNMKGQAGAPPDAFAKNGQNWGFPTYNWKEMSKNDYTWWKNRFRHLSKYFDAFRIDHILGFFRIWEIPYQQIQGILGVFNPAIPLDHDDLNSIGYFQDPNRFQQPYINEEILKDLFGAESSWIKSNFINSDWRFKEVVNTQRKIELFFKNYPEKEYLKEQLFNLIAEVLILEDEAGNLHPRFNLHETNSFRALNNELQNKLTQLYHDYFYVRQEDYWAKEAKAKLPSVIGATNMLICGEDLGLIPSCVPGVMDELGILSLEIQRMSKNPAHLFVNQEDIPYLSVMSTSTHDMEPLRLWWETATKSTIQLFYNTVLQFSGDAPEKCSSSIIQRIINLHLNWPGMWAIFPLQDLLALDPNWNSIAPDSERINIPSNPHHIWNYRFPVTLESLAKNDILTKGLKGMVSASGR